MMRMREAKIRLLMLVELEECRKELDLILRYHDCIINNCPEYYPLMPLPIPPGSAKTLARRVEMAEKGILPPSYNMVLNKYFPPPVHQSPVLSQH